MNDEWQGRGLYLVPATDYASLSREIDALLPRVTAGSTLQFDLNRKLVQRRQLWMRANGLGVAGSGKRSL